MLISANREILLAVFSRRFGSARRNIGYYWNMEKPKTAVATLSSREMTRSLCLCPLGLYAKSLCCCFLCLLRLCCWHDCQRFPGPSSDQHVSVLFYGSIHFCFVFQVPHLGFSRKQNKTKWRKRRWFVRVKDPVVVFVGIVDISFFDLVISKSGQ